MQQLILDGYNIIHKIPQLAAHIKTGLEGARKALANFMLTWKQTHGYNGAIYIVFDGREGIISNNENICGIKCVYTKTKNEADDRIISMVRNSKNPASLTVVSSDNYVTNNCKAHGAKALPAQFLLETLKSRTQQADEKLSPAAEKDINEFLKKKWGL